MKTYTRKAVLLLLITLFASSPLASCGSDDNPDAKNDTSIDSAAEVNTETYKFSTEYSGDEINVLNIENIFSMHAVIDTAETNGDTLNDTQFNAVRKLEDKMGIIWIENNVGLQTEFQTLVPQLILAGDDVYDIIYQNASTLNNFSSQGYYYNLLDYGNIQIDEDWWLSSYNDYNIVNGKLFTALGYSNMTVVDAIGCINFNQSMMEDLGLDLPYDYVRNGTWTFDVFQTYLKAAANLNGDASFKWTDDGNCVWGISMASNAGEQWLRACGEYGVNFDKGMLTMTAGTESFYNASVKIADMLGATDGTIYFGTFSGDDAAGSYINCFEAERALFGCSEIAKANRMRNMNYTFGVLPYPKYDETQDRYYMGVSFPASGVSIPATCVNPERSAVVGDAINYIFYTDVWPVFREVTLETKNLRNEDSIEMLDIILNSTYPDLMTIYGIDSAFMTDVSAKLRQGDSSVASVFAAHEAKILDDIEKVNNQ